MFYLLIIFVFSKSLNIDGNVYNSLIVNGNKRKFLLFHPNPTKSLPLWIFLHGQSYNAKTFVQNTDFFYVANDKEVITLFPEGHCTLEHMCCWNTGNLKGLTYKEWELDDVVYLDEVISQVKSNFDINEIVMVGFSAGAFMAHTYAINTTKHEMFSVIPVAGHIGGVSYPWLPPVINYNPTNFGVQSSHRPNIVLLFGGGDIFIKIDGGMDILGRIDFSMKEDLDFWMNQNECSDQDKTSITYDIEEQLKMSIHGKNCKKKVISIIVKDALHSWASYDKIFLNDKKDSFALYSKTLSEFLFYINEHVIKEVEYPIEDPDTNPPTDGNYPLWPFSISGAVVNTNLIYFITLLFCILILQ